MTESWQEREADDWLQTRIDSQDDAERDRAARRAERADALFWHYPEGWREPDTPFG